ncbi:hypothetical protein PPYR_04142 [Photinus pyralis]|uniref:Protein kinase domain-containing protein n=1 Tax=Photinus pyralis TaxID=7054 RepID=A0A5N4AXA7_PHOPY|nr:hypothetical protein PPYR_04142 [Photinus pyralis]
MEVFNKLYTQVSSSVSSTVSQLSGVLPGNPVTREFDASSHIASGGPGLLWKIYKGFKRSTKQEAAIFVLEKRQLDKFSKSDKEMVLDGLRRGVSQLTKIRHPRILTVQHPLEESRESLAFATEPVFASLANILGETVNMPQPANLSDYKFYDIEIKFGLLQIGEGLAFLHNDVKLLHRNICPESIIINQQGAWKVFGFDFCVHNIGTNQAFYPFQQYDFTLPCVSQPNLEYVAPEYTLTETHSTSSDLFSLGMLAYVLHSLNHHTLVPAKDWQQFKNRPQQLKTLSNNKLQCLPDSLREYVKMMLNVVPELRPDAHQFIKIPYFEDVGVKTLTYLDSLLQWDNLQRSQFYKGLPEALSKLPQRVRVQQALPCLTRDLAQPTMIPFVLPSILDVAEECNEAEYVTKILPHLKPVMKLVNPIQILLIFLQRMELLLKLTPATDIQQHVLPMLYRGLDSDTPQIHELCLSVLPTFAGLLDHGNVKNSVLPRIKKLCLSTSTLSVRVNCLLCIGRLLEHLDKWLVLDEVLPFLPQIPSREPAVIMGILGIYKLAMTHKKLGITKEIMATRVLPFLIPLCIENGLTLQQFNALVALVTQMFQLVESEHRTKLEQLNTVQEHQKILENSMPTIRILNQQDTVKILQNQTKLDPIPITTNTSQVQPVNLTNTLSPIAPPPWYNPSASSRTSNTFTSSSNHTSQASSNFQAFQLSHSASANSSNSHNDQFGLSKMNKAPTMASFPSQNFQPSFHSPNLYTTQNVMKPSFTSKNTQSGSISLSKDEIMDFLK